MSTFPSIVPTGYAGTNADFAKAPADYSGAVRQVHGTVLVPNLTAADANVGLVPFRKGARIEIHSTSIYAGNFGAGTTTLNIGYLYSETTDGDGAAVTSDVDAWASLSTAPQAGGFVTVDEKEGLNWVAAADGWLCAQLKTAAADADDTIYFSVNVAYG